MLFVTAWTINYSGNNHCKSKASVAFRVYLRSGRPTSPTPADRLGPWSWCSCRWPLEPPLGYAKKENAALELRFTLNVSLCIGRNCAGLCGSTLSTNTLPLAGLESSGNTYRSAVVGRPGFTTVTRESWGMPVVWGHVVTKNGVRLVSRKPTAQQSHIPHKKNQELLSFAVSHISAHHICLFFFTPI